MTDSTPGTFLGKTAATWEGMAAWAEAKADEAAASDAPWALNNLRLYQNKMSLWLQNAALARKES